MIKTSNFYLAYITVLIGGFVSLYNLYDIVTTYIGGNCIVGVKFWGLWVLGLVLIFIFDYEPNK